MPQEPDDSQRDNDKVWLDLFEPLHYASDTNTADRAAKLLDYLLLQLEAGPRGVTNAGVCLENALRLIFPFTAMGRTSMVLFLVSMGKDFPNKPDTMAALSEAMKRTKAALERASVAVEKRKDKRSRC